MQVDGFLSNLRSHPLHMGASMVPSSEEVIPPSEEGLLGYIALLAGEQLQRVPYLRMDLEVVVRLRYFVETQIEEGWAPEGVPIRQYPYFL